MLPASFSLDLAGACGHSASLGGWAWLGRGAAGQGGQAASALGTQRGGAGPSMGLASRCGSITSATGQRPGGAWTRVDAAWGAVTDTL